MSEVDPRFRALLGTLTGLLVGGVLYGLVRSLLPAGTAVAAAVVGVFGGLGAKAGRAIGSHAQLRVIIFGTLLATTIGEYAVFAETTPAPNVDLFVEHLLADGWWLAQTIFFLVAGIFFGVRLLVGTDPLGDVLEHAAGAVPPGAHGTPCPRCGSVQTAPTKAPQELECVACAHVWTVPQTPGPRDGEAPAA